MDKLQQGRLIEIYDELIDETENPNTVNCTQKKGLLRFGLDLLEYILEEGQDSPIDTYFL